uniref:Uncharacterized protein n=1 Tax=Magallana gigas TaxID=29159 RepID=K1QIW5_MAGGI
MQAEITQAGMTSHLRQQLNLTQGVPHTCTRKARTPAGMTIHYCSAATTTNTSRYDRTLVSMRYRAEMTAHSVSLVRKTRRLERAGMSTPSISPYLFKFNPKQSLVAMQ